MSYRKIKFRGKNNQSRWVYGALIPPEFSSWYEPSIYDGNIRAEVDSETIGQYTGNNDVGGDEIYEGDILESRASSDKRDWKKWVVQFSDGAFTTVVIKNRKRKISPNEITVVCDDEIKFYGFFVIGNIHDNNESQER